ncbi:N-acetylmuramoyl-L-alanine amidase [Enterococcus sp. ALS3]|uniref:N-acetylmuramoyl-L-alanine amidase n=1 Tax=Enterococcus alishanensis TaxID=1303817 RepID=A0ABS6TDU5_9ENTE|nr:N-acetylmuramoyl-L-alanine amidase [Enterococcus alishanensis]MBV7391042.1 N-acetylmuramoyl-L-alanine amidase [Enterococcus alishanensis]
MALFYSGIAGKRPGKAKGWVLHNDAGSQAATSAYYRAWLPTHDAYLGFAHAYTASDGTHFAEDYDYMAYHTANSEGNMWYLGIEFCQSMGNENTFRQNEQDGFKVVARWFIDENMTPNRSTVKLHREFSATACPHRSWALHGQSTNVVKDYYIAQIVLAMAELKGITVEKEEIKLKELGKMEFLFTVKGEGATFWHDGHKTFMLSDEAQLNMINGNYEQVHGKKPASVRQLDQNEYKVWQSMYPVTVAKKTW